MSHRLLTVAVWLVAAIAAAQEPGSASLGTFHTRNSAGRTGTYLLPPGFEGRSLPLLVIFHGTGGSGRSILIPFAREASEKKFLIVAPDSRRSPRGEWTWEVGDKPDDVTEDLSHALRCIEEMRAIRGVKIDPERILVAGYSGGGSMAPYLASRLPLFRAFAVLHGGVFEGGLGSERPRGWLSTGQTDPLRTVAEVQGHTHRLEQTKGFSKVVFRSYPGGHELSPKERSDLLDWWLGQ